MKTSQHVVAYVWQETFEQDALAEPLTSSDTVRAAERRATVMFDLLLTYLAGPDSTSAGRPTCI